MNCCGFDVRGSCKACAMKFVKHMIMEEIGIIYTTELSAWFRVWESQNFDQRQHLKQQFAE